MTAAWQGGIAIRLFRVWSPDETAYEVVVPEKEGPAYANFLAGQLLDAAADASGEEFGYSVSAATVWDGPPTIASAIMACRLVVSPPPSPTAPPCRVERQGDEIFCATCVRRWPVDDDEIAPCPRVPA